MEKNSVLEHAPSEKKNHLNKIWHPYTQAKTSADPIHITSAKGCHLLTDRNTEIIDAISSWWSILHGHKEITINKAIEEQLTNLGHVMLGGFTHTPANMLAKSLLSILPSGYSKVFYSDNGSTAVETAIKASLQYFYNENPTTLKRKAIAFKEGYHGDTFGSMSVSDRNLFSKPFSHQLFETEFIDPPKKGYEEKSIKQLKTLLDKNEFAFFIFEPIIQGAAGMKKHSAEGLSALIELCQQSNVLTIADEVLTGFGRLGPLFASEMLKKLPDIICLSKGITGGVLPFGATIFKEKIYERFYSNDLSKAFLHGHTYCGNPICCAASIASIELLKTKECFEKRKNIQKMHEEFFQKIQNHPHIQEGHVTGTILQLQYKDFNKSNYYNSKRETLLSFFRKYNILIRPIGNILYLIPPYCISKKELNQIYEAISESLKLGL